MVEVDTQQWCQAVLLTPALGGSNPDTRPGRPSTLHESWNSTQCRVSTQRDDRLHAPPPGGVCPVSMLVSHSGAGMGQVSALIL